MSSVKFVLAIIRRLGGDKVYKTQRNVPAAPTVHADYIPQLRYRNVRPWFSPLGYFVSHSRRLVLSTMRI